MTNHVIQIDKQKFVCGLFWQSLSRPRELRKEAAELAAKIEFDLMVLRRDHGTVQAGYANTADGLRRGMLSLGAAVSKSIAIEGANFDGKQQKVTSWIGAFRLPDDHWAYFAVRDESFLPNGDFAGTREEVVERLKKDYALGGWNVVLGEPELQELGFHNFQSRTIAQCLPRRRGGGIRVHGWWALESVDRRITWKPVAAVCAVLAVAAVGTSWFMKHRLDEAARSAAAMRAAPPAKVPAPRPWPKQPLPLAMTEGCLRALTDIVPGGWRLENHHCTAAAAIDAWVRGDSTVDKLLEHVPNAVIELNGEKARRSLPLAIEVQRRDEALLNARDLLPAITGGLQRLGLVPSLTLVPVPKPPPASAKQPQVEPPDWQTFKLKVNARGIPPTEVAAVLERPGVRLEKLTYAGESWSIEGVIYAK
jgi:hypothetical protein